MKKISVLSTFLVILVCPSVFGTIINIPADYQTIQQGIDSSNDGDTVLVQPGTYVENIDFGSHTITLASLFLTTQDTSYISSTIIDGDSSGSVVAIEDGGGTITGFTIQNGYAIFGGGIRCHQTPSTISNNIIRRNTATYDGGGICTSYFSSTVIINNTIYGNSAPAGGGIYNNWGGSPISNNIITGNSAVSGAGIYEVWSSAEVNNNIISGNTADSLGGGYYTHNSYNTITDNIFYENHALDGGGIYFNSSDPTFSNNIVEANIALNNGGGIYIDAHSPTINNNLIIGNAANNNGGGLNIYLSYGSSIYNNTISRNSAGYRGGGIYILNGNSYIFNTIVWADSALHGDEIYLEDSELSLITYCDIQGGWGGEGNIHYDPLFVDPENGDYHLQRSSPCIDAGDPDSPYDPDGTISDMGAFYFDQTTGLDDVPKPNIFNLSQNYPNPFNARTTIEYSLAKPSYVTIEIFDILGRVIETLVQNEQSTGNHRLIWNANNVSTGIYFYRIQTAGHTETKKMVLLK